MVTRKDRSVFIKQNKVPSCSSVDMNVRTIFAIQDKEGMILDFGVYKAKSTNFFAGHFSNRKVYGFDSFYGLPEKYTDRLVKGSFSLDGKLPRVEKNVELIVGTFQTTLDSFCKEHKDEPVAFVNIDCDLKSSTLYVLRTLYKYNKLSKGTVIRFDEFFNVEDNELYATEYEAFIEFQKETGIKINWIGASNNWQVFTGVVK